MKVQSFPWNDGRAPGHLAGGFQMKKTSLFFHLEGKKGQKEFDFNCYHLHF